MNHPPTTAAAAPGGNLPPPLNAKPSALEAAARARSSATLRIKCGRVLWAGVEATLFRCSWHGMYGWRAWLLRRFGAKVGPGCRVRRTAAVYYPWNLVLGRRVIVGDAAQLYSLAKIELGDGAMLSQEAYVCAGTHDYTDLALPLVTMPVAIGAEAWVCARAFIGPGVKIGCGAVVAAGSVVVKDVEPWMVVGGNPAKPIKKRELKASSRAKGPI